MFRRAASTPNSSPPVAQGRDPLAQTGSDKSMISNTGTGAAPKLAIVRGTVPKSCVALAFLTLGAFPADAQSDKGHPARAEQAVAYNGDAPYVCSPSGFGQTSTCVPRTRKSNGG